MSGDGDGSSDSVEQRMDDNQTDAFDILGHELRLSIVETLGARQRANAWRPVPMEFEEIRRAVDSDDSGRFNYHLGELLGTYVEQTDDGYVLSPAGFEVSSAILRGSYADVSVGPVEGTLDDDCPKCGADVTGVYEDGLLRIDCPEHGVMFDNTVAPAVAVDRDIGAITTAAERDARRTVERARDGICPECFGTIEMTVPAVDTPRDEPAPADSNDEPVLAEFDCQRCRLAFETELHWVALDHPAVVAFYYDHGIDPRPPYHVELHEVSSTIVSEEPLRARLTFRLDDERLRVTLDDHGTVVETERG
jgi:hypothetical protein